MELYRCFGKINLKCSCGDGQYFATVLCPMEQSFGESGCCISTGRPRTIKNKNHSQSDSDETTNNHLISLLFSSIYIQLLAGQHFVDVTLACDGQQVHCHRLVLAACSSYFESLLSENPCKHPIIILPKEIKLWEIHALVDFMYKGQVNVSQAGLPQLLKCAETLQIRGLCGTDSTLNEVANGKVDHPLSPTNLLANCNPNFNFAPMFPPNIINATSYPTDVGELRQPNSDFQRIVSPHDMVNTKPATPATSIKTNDHFVKTKGHKSSEATTVSDGNGLPRKPRISLKRFSDIEANHTVVPEVNIKCEEIGALDFCSV